MKTAHEPRSFACSGCDYTFRNKTNLETHFSMKHTRSNRNDNSSPTYSYKERSENGHCSYWNYGTCKFGDQCKALHEEIPACRFQERCRNVQTCRFFHFVDKKTRFRGFQTETGTAGSPPRNWWGRAGL